MFSLPIKIVLFIIFILFLINLLLIDIGMNQSQTWMSITQSVSYDSYPGTLSLSDNVSFTIFNESDPMFIIRRPRELNTSHITGIDNAFLEFLSRSPPIPKLLHISWPNKDVLSSNTTVIEWGLKNFMKINPEWKVMIYNDSDIEQYLKQKLSVHDYSLLSRKHIIEKIDLWRLLIVYFEGGLYFDIDRFCNIPMDKILKGDTVRVLLPTHYDVNFAQDLMCSVPGNPIFKLSIELNLSKRRKFYRQRMRNGDLEWNNVSVRSDVIELGPQSYWEAVTKILFDVLMFDGGDYPDKFPVVVDKMRLLINESTDLIETYRETWCDTIMFHTDDIEKCQKIRKKPLWDETNQIGWEEEMRPVEKSRPSSAIQRIRQIRSIASSGSGRTLSNVPSGLY